MTEREMFLEWHYKQFLSENPTIDETNAKYIYDYSHTHVMVGQIRENLFMAWQSSASRESYKFVPVQPEFETMQNMSQALRDNTGETPKRKMQEVYKAAIGVME